ncbi:unnamed protein product [Malus baccata var. baccata]
MSSTATNSSSMHLNTVEPLTGVNYKKWKQDLEIVLGVMDWDLALRTEEPFTPTDGSTSNATNAKDFLKSIEQKYQKSLKTETDATNANDFLNCIEEKYQESPKIETGNLMNSPTTMRHDGIESVCDYTHLKLSYNALREKWDVNELISVCVSEEKRMKKFENEKIKSLNYVRSTTEHIHP